ncbi:MAG: AI-2E family transporter [Oscillatoriaceae cyanobacterium Prado104]|jgi:predicted PurR-regulated permease PerM|nr:AI-2E family transporter [Oscillatoriaceae cyanobacterium Prado104]
MKLGQWLGLLALVASFYILWQIRQLILLLFTSVVLAVAVNRLVHRFQKSGVKRIVAVWLSLGIAIALLVGFFLLIVPPFAEQFQQLIALFPAGLARIQEGINWIEERITGSNLLQMPDTNGFLEQLQPLGRNLLQRSIALFTNSLNTILELLLVLILTLMLLVNPRPYRQAFVRCFPSFYRDRVDEILSLCNEGLSSWTAGALIEMVFIAVLSGIGLWFLQVPLVLAHAFLAGLLNFIPNIGPTLSAVFPAAIAFLDAPWKAGAVLILYIIIQQIESYWLTPTVMAKQVALLPAITLTSQIFFASLFGFLGLLVALPLTVVAKTLIEEVLFKDILDKWNYKNND